MSLLAYLMKTKSNLAASLYKSLHIVIGNEACDLDSAVSAIVYAFLLHSLQKEEEERLVLPALNIPKEDYPLKTEVLHWLTKHNISENHLLFRDEIDPILDRASDFDLTLVDHNLLPTKDKRLEPNVILVLDHHKLEMANPENVRNGVVIEMVGSCATLVADEIFNKNQGLIDSTTSSLLYGTIILDTVNLNKAAQRVTAKDIEICKKLEKYLNPSLDSTEIFEELRAAKSNISSLTSEQLLRKDVKVAEDEGIRIAVASVPMTVQTYLERPDVSVTLNHHGVKNYFDAIVIMGISIIDGSVNRDICVFSTDSVLRKKVTDYLINASEGLLKLEPFSSNVPHCSSYHQKNYAASRKAVLPFLRDWLLMNKAQRQEL